MIKVKRTVRPYSLWILCAFVNAAIELGMLAEAWPDMLVTSGNDSVHKDGSAHYTDNALDFRTRMFTLEQKQALVAVMQRRLGPEFDLLLEDLGGPNEHLHAERDPVRGGIS